ncbi:MAG: hypothetical protein H7641_07290, partial [Candidatus Heimdallarchaeota archaeon]|nr:hypothetical protein [Candidatus Heimdallarchaeota archaeon]MCK4877369.1 hypothetical protein [Candidatus Heimdallarchaeota archaeon]
MDKSVAVSLKIIGFILIFTSAFIPLYAIDFDSAPAETEIIPDNPSGLLVSSGNLVRVLAFKVDYKLLTFVADDHKLTARYLIDEVPSSIIILSAALWFVMIFAVLATVLGQVFQSGGFERRGLIADISAALLL